MQGQFGKEQDNTKVESTETETTSAKAIKAIADVTISGGTLVSAGSSGMAQAPTDQSTEYSIIMNYSSVQKAGTIVNLKDSSGNTVATFAPEKDYQSVVITSPSLKKGTTYTLYSGGASTGSESNGFYTDGQYNPGGGDNAERQERVRP